MGSFLLLFVLMVSAGGAFRTMLRIARRTMKPDCGLILRDALRAPQDEGSNRG
jgi:hypothetical protein